MPVHDEDGSAVTSAPPLSSPPQPAATSASEAMSSASATSALRFLAVNLFLLTLGVTRWAPAAADVTQVSALPAASANDIRRGLGAPLGGAAERRCWTCGPDHATREGRLESGHRGSECPSGIPHYVM